MWMQEGAGSAQVTYYYKMTSIERVTSHWFVGSEGRVIKIRTFVKTNQSRAGKILSISNYITYIYMNT